MRVVTVVPLSPGPRGGVEDYAYSVVRHLRLRADLAVVAPRARGDVVEPLDGVPCQLLPAVPLFRRRWPWGRAAHRTLVRAVRDADLVHVHMPAPRLERWSAEIAAGQGTPVLATYHMDAIYDGGRIDARTGPWGRALQVLYDRFSAVPTLERTSVVVTNARGYARESRLLPGYSELVRVVRQGVDPAHVATPDLGGPTRQRLVPEGGPLILFLGRLVPYKGLVYLLEAFGNLPQRDAILAIAGSGPLRVHLEKLAARLGLTDRVRFLGFIPDPEVAGLLAAADVVVCPSITLAESTPIVLLEALACGTPVVGTRIGGSEESLPDDGVRGKLVPPRDSPSLADAIAALLESSPWSPARTPVAPRTWKDVADDYFTLYRSLLKE